MNELQQVVDLQSFQLQSLLGFAIPWVIRKAIDSNLPVLRGIQFSWARWLSLASAALVTVGIHLTWAGDWDILTGGTINMSLMAPGLPDIVNGLYQFFANEINYRVFHKPRPILELVVQNDAAPLSALKP